MHGYPVAAGAILGLIGMRLWHYHRMPRVQAALFAASAFLLTVGVTLWLDALAGLTGTGTGLTVLIVVLALGGLGAWFEVVHKHKHHRVLTPLICVVFGVAGVLGIALWQEIVRKSVKTSAKTGQALTQAITQIHSGNAGASMGRGEREEILLAGAGVLAFLVVLGFRHEKGKKGSSGGGSSPAPARRGRAVGRGSAPRAITSGKRR